MFTLSHIPSIHFSTSSCILTGKRNPTVKFCHVLHVAHKHELHKLTMTTILSQALGLLKLSILTGKRNATVKFYQVSHVAHKHEPHKLTMTRILSQAWGYFNLFCFPGMLANIHAYILTAVTIFFLLNNLSQILDVAFHLPVSIYSQTSAGLPVCSINFLHAHLHMFFISC